MDHDPPQPPAPGLDPVEKLVRAAESEGLSYLVIGGHAVVSWANHRTTRDFDLMVLETDLPRWRFLAETAGFVWGYQTASFVQFAAPAGTGMPLDLMLADANTFEKMAANSEARELGSGRFPVPRPLDLVAMKLFALRSRKGTKRSSDAHDIAVLIEKGNLDVRDPEFRAIVSRYASDETKSWIETEFGS